MTSPTATTKISVTQNDLQAYFRTLSDTAFDLCWEAHTKAGFYAKLLGDIQKGRVLSDELPEAQGVSAAALRSVIQKQQRLAIAAAESAWELAGTVGKEFRTTVRSALPAGESVPQYDIEYEAKNTHEPAKVRIKTWRRNITIELVGSGAALDELHALVTVAVLKS